MNPYEPPQTKLAKLDGPTSPSPWLLLIFGFPFVLIIALLFFFG
jgi:hypothetical protein